MEKDPFFQNHRKFLRIDASGKTPEPLRKWVGWVESRLRILLLLLELKVPVRHSVLSFETAFCLHRNIAFMFVSPRFIGFLTPRFLRAQDVKTAHPYPDCFDISPSQAAFFVGLVFVPPLKIDPKKVDPKAKKKPPVNLTPAGTPSRPALSLLSIRLLVCSFAAMCFFLNLSFFLCFC